MAIFLICVVDYKSLPMCKVEKIQLHDTLIIFNPPRSSITMHTFQETPIIMSNPNIAKLCLRLALACVVVLTTASVDTIEMNLV